MANVTNASVSLAAVTTSTDTISVDSQPLTAPTMSDVSVPVSAMSYASVLLTAVTTPTDNMSDVS